MKKILKRIGIYVIVLAVLFSVKNSSVYAAEGINDITEEQEVVIGKYDGPLNDCLISNSTTRDVSNVRVNSFATYSKSAGITVYIQLYVPPFETPQPEFLSMSGVVSTTMHNRTEQDSYYTTANGTPTISANVSTGVMGASGEKGDIKIAGVATAKNALGFGGGYSIAYPVTIP